MKLRVSPRARREADRIDAWWRENRRAARDLFTRELLDTLERILHDPQLGIHYEAKRFDGPVRRILLHTTKYHLFYGIDRNELVVLAVWSARRGRAPKL